MIQVSPLFFRSRSASPEGGLRWRAAGWRRDAGRRATALRAARRRGGASGGASGGAAARALRGRGLLAKKRSFARGGSPKSGAPTRPELRLAAFASCVATPLRSVFPLPPPMGATLAPPKWESAKVMPPQSGKELVAQPAIWPASAPPGRLVRLPSKNYAASPVTSKSLSLTTRDEIPTSGTMTIFASRRRRKTASNRARRRAANPFLAPPPANGP